MKTAYLETWTEMGFGQRSDGCSIHLTPEDYKKYVKKYWDGMPDKVQEEYERPDSNLKEVVLSNSLFKKVVKSEKFGIRLFQSDFEELKTKNEILFKG